MICPGCFAGRSIASVILLSYCLSQTKELTESQLRAHAPWTTTSTTPTLRANGGLTSKDPTTILWKLHRTTERSGKVSMLIRGDISRVDRSQGSSTETAIRWKDPPAIGRLKTSPAMTREQHSTDSRSRLQSVETTFQRRID